MNKILRKIGVLSLSTVTGSATVVTMIIPMLALEYYQVELTNIEGLITISSFSALVTVLANDWITKKIGIKKTVLIGLISGAIMGLLPLFLRDYHLLYLSRIGLGLSIGLFSPHAISLISLFYSGEEKASMLGYQIGIGALGNALLITMAGIFSSWMWRAAFGVYLFLGIIAIVISLLVPTIPKVEKNQQTSKVGMSKTNWTYMVLCFFTFLIIWGVQLKIPTLITQDGLGSGKVISGLLALMNLAGMAAGLLFGRLHRQFKNRLLPIGYFGAAIGVFGIFFFNNLVLIFIFAIFFNFIYSFTGPYITLQVNSGATTAEVTKINSWLTVAMISSSFAAPYVWNTLATVFQEQNQTTVALMLMFVSLVLLGGIVVLSQKTKKVVG